MCDAQSGAAVGLRLAGIRSAEDAAEGLGMSLFNTHPLAISEFRQRTEKATTVTTYAYKCKKCRAEMKSTAGRRKYQFGGWICPECAKSLATPRPSTVASQRAKE